MSEWKPISTAPKNSRRCIWASRKMLRQTKYPVVLVRWDHVPGWQQPRFIVVWPRPDYYAKQDNFEHWRPWYGGNVPPDPPSTVKGESDS